MDLFVLIAACLATYLVIRWAASSGDKTRRFMSSSSKIEDFKDGLPGCVIGVVRLFEGQTVRAPLTGRHVVAFRLVAMRWDRNGSSVDAVRGRGEWEKRFVDSGSVPFFVEDATGRALVLRGDFALSSRTTGLGAAENIEQIKRENPSLRDREGFEFQESVLCAGDRVAVRGIGHLEEAGDATSEATEGAAAYRTSGRAANRMRLVFQEAEVID